MQQNLQIKVLLVVKNGQDLEKLLNADWRVANSYTHPLGTLFVLAKPKVNQRKK